MAVKESKKGAARPRRSKEETQHEFARIQEDVEASQQSTDAKTVEAARLHETQIRQRVDGVSVEAVVQRISGLGLEVSRALAEVSEKLTAEVQQLAVVREAVALERRELSSSTASTWQRRHSTSSFRTMRARSKAGGGGR